MYNKHLIHKLFGNLSTEMSNCIIIQKDEKSRCQEDDNRPSYIQAQKAQSQQEMKEHTKQATNLSPDNGRTRNVSLRQLENSIKPNLLPSNNNRSSSSSRSRNSSRELGCKITSTQSVAQPRGKCRPDCWVRANLYRKYSGE